MMILWLVLSGALSILSSVVCQGCPPKHNYTFWDPALPNLPNCSNGNESGNALDAKFKLDFVNALDAKFNHSLPRWPPYNCDLELNATNISNVQEKVTAKQGFWTPLTEGRNASLIASELSHPKRPIEEATARMRSARGALQCEI
ncbi:unnamed protein product [Cylicocyclus nassatus]|uniref:Uncharacterized protein n=1 Tax=Cylicocyclus nassatus TaxID=53992 RepID=A0AA36GK92_CYLNA|nr:unnamed protein product [Cylicocyclus nassatus]